VRFASPDAYTPKHLAAKILTSRAALEGERKQVTVLFADLKGSMELVSGRDPEDARKLLDPVLEWMMDAVHHYEGTVNQVMGDGIMALFGAPVAHEDHAVRACYAALRMQESVGRLGDGIQRSHGVPLQIRVGIHSGEVVVRSVGSDLHMDYTAVGQTTHLAARMEQMAKPGSVLLTADTLRQAEGFVQTKTLGPVSIKGLAEPVKVFELVGTGLLRSRFQAAAARGLTRFVGRQTELDQLRQALEQAGTGHGQVVAPVGEPGVGKSRLFWEFTHFPVTQGWLILRSSAVSYGKTMPYLPVIDLLKAYFQIEDRDDQRRIHEKVTGKLFTLDRALAPSAFLALLDLPVEESTWRALDPPQRRQQTLEAVKRLMLRESQVQPLLLVFEDLHWIDTETQTLLDSLVDSIPSARILLLVNYRSEYRHTWGRKSYYTEIRLDPLPPQRAEELLHDLLGDAPALQPLKQILITRAEGTPLFLEEIVRTLVETHVLVGERGAYRLAGAVGAMHVPATVQAVLATRIDRLSSEEKRLLQSASIIGKVVPFSLLQAIAELSPEALRNGLAQLQTAEFLYETNLFPDLEYSFKHALTHEVAYASILHERRRVLHARIVDALEMLYSDRLPEQIERLAHHAIRGEVWDKAVTYSRQAGIKAFVRSANREASKFFEQALAALQHVEESPERIGQAIDLRFDLRSSLLPLGEIDTILGHLREAETLAIKLGDQARLGRALSFLANLYYLKCDHERAIESGQHALAIATTLGDVRLQVGSNLYLGQVYHALGDYQRAVDYLRRNVEALESDVFLERLGMAGLPVVSRGWLIWCLAELGEFPEGIVHAREALRIAEATKRGGSLIVACSANEYLYLWIGDFPHAIAVGQRGLEIFQTGNFPLLFPIVGMPLGYAYAMSGRVAEGTRLLEQAVEQSASMRLMTNHSLQVAFLSEAYLLAGRVEEALRCAQRALDLSRQNKERGYQAWVLRLLGEIHAHRQPCDSEQPESLYQQALALAKELRMRPLVAHCHFGIGKLYRRMGKGDQAREQLTTATTMYREMDMTYWLEQAKELA
jgi:class 3 adenylate cyclase/tetratricopeptide (TPR) repeat protein